MRELIADLFISLDGFASGADEAAYFGYFGSDLENWVRENLEKRQVILMGDGLGISAKARMSCGGMVIRSGRLPRVT